MIVSFDNVWDRIFNLRQHGLEKEQNIQYNTSRTYCTLIYTILLRSKKVLTQSSLFVIAIIVIVVMMITINNRVHSDWYNSMYCTVLYCIVHPFLSSSFRRNQIDETAVAKTID